MPVVVYYPVPRDFKKTQFTAMFGASRKDGSFIFYSYDRAMSILKEDADNGNNEDKEENKKRVRDKHGIVRIALHTGSTTIDKEEYDENQDIDTFYHGYEYQVKRYEQQKPLSYHRVSNRNNYNIIL